MKYQAHFQHKTLQDLVDIFMFESDHLIQVWWL